MMHRSATSARFVIIVACFFGRWLAGVDAAAMTVSGVFGDHMVLERDRPVPVWGTADPGERVTVRFAEQTHEAAADERGRWRVCLDPMPAAKEPRRLGRARTPADPGQARGRQRKSLPPFPRSPRGGSV